MNSASNSEMFAEPVGAMNIYFLKYLEKESNSKTGFHPGIYRRIDIVKEISKFLEKIIVNTDFIERSSVFQLLIWQQTDTIYSADKTIHVK